MRQLLALPAPTPHQAQAPGAAEPMPRRPQNFFAKANPPADDAPLEDLMEYWGRGANTAAGPVLSEVSKQRLLDARNYLFTLSARWRISA